MAVNYTVLNSQLSALRNMFLTSSVGIVVIGFSNVFEGMYADIMRIMGAVVLFYSMVTGIIASYTFWRYVIENVDKNEPEYKRWMSWVYMGYIYAVIILIIFAIFSYKKLSIKNKNSSYRK